MSLKSSVRVSGASRIAVARGMACLAVLALPACVAQHRVEGFVEGGQELFQGGALRDIDGAGILSVTSNLGAHCVGNYVFTQPGKGGGTFRCSDGRTGPFEFVSTGFRGTGIGSLGSKRFTFTFG